jgi:hypothetical protein
MLTNPFVSVIMVTTNIAFAKGVFLLFHSARWKAYLQKVQDNGNGDADKTSESISTTPRNSGLPTRKKTVIKKPPRNTSSGATT